MTPHLKAFLDELEERDQDTSVWLFTDDDRGPRMTLAAEHPSVGPLIIYDEGHELTLEFGTKYHCHFDGSDCDTHHSDGMSRAATLTADLVIRILRLQIGVAVYFNELGCTGASLIDLDELGLSADNFAKSTAGVCDGTIRTERFLWSGPVPNPN